MTVDDLSDTIIAKSDQLNADDLLSGPIDVTVTRVARGDRDQPVAIHIDGDRQPFKPCKTMRRLLICAWGNDGRDWVGRSMRLYRDPEVMFSGVKVGGIRISALSHIAAPLDLMLTATRGKKARHRVDVLQARQATRTLDTVLADLGLTRDEVNAWLKRDGKRSLDEDPHDGLAGWLDADHRRAEVVRGG